MPQQVFSLTAEVRVEAVRHFYFLPVYKQSITINMAMRTNKGVASIQHYVLPTQLADYRRTFPPSFFYYRRHVAAVCETSALRDFSKRHFGSKN